MWKVLLSDPDKRKEQAHQLLEWCVQDEKKHVNLALNKGMEVATEQVSGAPISGSPMGKVNATQPQSMKPRALARMDTNEEHERVKKQSGDMGCEGALGRDAATVDSSG